MKTSYKVLIAAVIVAIPTTAALAHGMKQRKIGAEHAAIAKEMFEAMDADKDGKVTQAEIFAYRSDRFAAADTDGNGALSAEELDGLMAEHRAHAMERRLAMMDTDGDGTVGSEEFSRMRGPWMHHIDRNGDGAIDKDELERASKHMGKRYFRHHTGKHHGHGQD